MQSYFDFSTEVKQALAEHKPIVALESTSITHGLPFPKNLEVAQAAEEILRKQNVVPAIIAVMEGKIKIGLTADELHTLVQDKNTIKASKRDLSYALATKANAGVTISAALFCAEYAGIRIFATGGIGGVHRGDGSDVSADLIELSKTSIAVIASGARSMLDLGKTLETLESYSVPIVGYKTDTFPAFYSRSSNYPLSNTINDVETLAELLRTHWRLGLPASVLITNPIPAKNEILPDKMEDIIQTAIAKAEEKNIQGNSITPFLLDKIGKLTKGKSIEANIALIKNNVELAGELAKVMYEEKTSTEG